MSIQEQIDIVNERIRTTNGRMTELDMKVNQTLLSVLEMMKDNDQRWKVQQAESKTRHERWEAEMKANQKTWEKERREFRKEMGALSHRLGTIVEDFVAPNLPQILRDVANLPHEVEVVVNTRVRRRRPDDRGQTLEFDATAVARNFALINETKTSLRPEHVELFVTKRLPLIQDYFPSIKAKRSMPQSPLFGSTPLFNSISPKMACWPSVWSRIGAGYRC